MENKNVLEIKYPPITAYEEAANTLAILLNDDRTEAWIYSNFIATEVYESGGKQTKVHFYRKVCDWIDNRSVPYDMLGITKVEIVDFLINCINKGYYVRFVIDWFYIPAYDETTHNAHNILIYGFDRERRVFNIADNFQDGKYSFEECTFEELEQAYISAKNEDIRFKSKYFNLMSLRNNFNYQFDLEYMIKELKEYIHSEDMSRVYRRPIEQFKNNWKYGMDCYKFLHQLIDDAIQSADDKYVDIRSFHFIYDHKTIMLHRIEYLNRINMIKDDNEFHKRYKEIQKASLVARNLLLKYLISNDKNLLVRIKDKLVYIEKNEYQVLSRLIMELEQNR